MARQEKKNLDWFMLNCQLDDKFELIESEFGITGFAVIVKLFMKIYGGEGYYCEWNDDVALVFAKRNGVGAGVVSEIISAAVRRGIFDRKMYEEHSVLTSAGIQKRYFSITGRRKNSRTEYLLVSYTQKSESAGSKADNAGNMRAEKRNNVSKNPTEKTREDKRRKDDIIEDKRRYGAHEKVKLSGEEYSRLKAMSSEFVVKKYISKLDEWCYKSGKSCHSCYDTIAEWILRDGRGTESTSERSYDLDKWQELADNFDPNELGFEEDDE
jgi:hypothetical protein